MANPGFYPFPDSVYNSINMNLCVINNPDSLGQACDFQPHSFYLGGYRSYAGLPNNPQYDLGPVIGSGCDTITSTINVESQLSIGVYPNPFSNEFTVYLNLYIPGTKAEAFDI